MIFGSGILKSLGITLKSFIFSYFKKPEEGGIFTVEYPEERLPVKENFRNFPFLVFDETPENLRCVACDICAKECPPKCIYIVREFDAAGKPLKRPAIFDVDYTVCMNCGICEEVCPFDAIFMDHKFEIADRNRQQALLFHKEDLLKPNTYFQEIRPTHASEIDTKRKAAAEKKRPSTAATTAPENDAKTSQEKSNLKAPDKNPGHAES